MWMNTGKMSVPEPVADSGHVLKAKLLEEVVWVPRRGVSQDNVRLLKPRQPGQHQVAQAAEAAPFVSPAR